MFCNSDIGLNKGSCESCDGRKDEKSCEAGGLPDLGVKECKARCLGNDPSKKKKDEAAKEGSPEYICQNSVDRTMKADDKAKCTFDKENDESN